MGQAQITQITPVKYERKKPQWNTLKGFCFAEFDGLNPKGIGYTFHRAWQAQITQNEVS